MRFLGMFVIMSLCVSSVGAAQSLADLAAAEKQRRERLREEESDVVRTYDAYDLTRAHHGLSTASDGEEAAAPDTATIARLEQEQGRASKPPLVLASLVGEAMPEATKDVEFQRSRGGQLPMQAGAQGITSTNNMLRLKRNATGTFFDGTLYTDLFHLAYDDGLSSSQVSTRVKLEAGRRPGGGWRFFMDGRHRYRTGSSSPNKLLLYDARVIYDDARSPFRVSLGQMNLYDTAGVGQLAGGVVGYALNRSWTLGGYGGLEPDIYAAKYDLDYTKYGVFTQFRGSGAKSASFSYNRLQFGGLTEREYVYGSGLVPIGNVAVVYGSAEYELVDGLLAEDRLSHLFLNTRYSFSSAADVTAYYSSGRGLDFHRFLIEQSKNPDRHSAELERFYYSESFGVRLSYKPHQRVRVFVAQRESEQKDTLVENHTTQFGASSWDIFGSGIGVYGSYNINRGDLSENDSYRFSLTRDFGPLSWTGYYSSTFNGVRFDATTGLPEIVRLTDRSTISNDFWFNVTEAFALSLEHDHSSRGAEKENSLFFRVMFRF